VAPERKLTRLDLVAGPAGWVEARWRRHPEPERRAFLRFNLDGTRWTKPDLWMPGATTMLLRDIPLARIELALNASDVKAALAERLEEPGPEDPEAAFSCSVTIQGARAGAGVGVAAGEPVTLQRPARRRPLPDEFFQDVAAAYRHAVGLGLDPGPKLATDTGAPAGTVARWISEARRREYLPSTTRGKVSA
jgi:hypothetical protein